MAWYVLPEESGNVFISVYQRQCWLPATMLAGLLKITLLDDLTRHCERSRAEIPFGVEKKQHEGCMWTLSIQDGSGEVSRNVVSR
jgi:hypothetical protein